MIEGKIYHLDDGKRDAHYNSGSGDAIVFNAYTADSKYQTIDFISVGLSNLGNPSAVFLYQDKDNDKQPDSDEKILEVDTNLLEKEGFAHIAINPTRVENTFFVGALYEQNNQPTITDGSFNDALKGNAEVYFAYQGANTDKFDHIRLIDDNTFGFEDLPNGGDFDYDDLIIKMDFTI